MSKKSFGTGRIGEIIAYLKETYNISLMNQLSTEIKLNTLCHVLQLSATEFDKLIALNSPVMRTIKGHVFETVFDFVISQSGHEITEIGGDGDIDRIVNGFSLQLKTPNVAGTVGKKVQFKTHETHGAKSEIESSAYYHSVEHFADYFVGLISYNPFNVIILSRDELPTHSIFSEKIISPFTLIWENHKGLNNFERIGVKNYSIDSTVFMSNSFENELLPRCSELLGLKSDVVLNTILNESNFRIWDMSIRGFAREVAFKLFLESNNVKPYKSDVRRERADKADLALKMKGGIFYFLQMKGLSVNNCRFSGSNSVISVETQLTRGRVNDHLTQSRLYQILDFDYLIIGVDPVITQKYHTEQNKTTNLSWEFYAIPSKNLSVHPNFPNRLKSLQSFRYADIQRFLINADWLDMWEKII